MDAYGIEEQFEASGALQPVGENETTVLFRDMEHELEVLTQRHHVPPEDLEQLFQVIQGMFDYMDSTKEALDRTEIEKNELEDLWKQEKDKLRATQRRKLELECRLEEERMKIESEKTTLEKDKVALQTRVKQLGEQKESAEQELQRMKEKTVREEEMRKDLLEQYKKQADMVRTQTLKRRGSQMSLNRRKLPTAPYRRDPTSSLTTNLRAQPATDQLEDSIRSDNFLEGSAEVPQEPFQDTSPVHSCTPTSHIPSHTSETSLHDELHQAQAGGGSPDQETEEPLPLQNGEEFDESLEMDPEVVWSGYPDTEGTSMMEEMFLNTPMRAEVEMLQREKEIWAEEREKMEQTVRATREEREEMERQQAETQVEVRQLRENLRKLQDQLNDVKTERDEILGHYLEQPFDEFCVTKKELSDLLKKQQKTAIDLQLEKEEKEKLQRLLASKRSFFEKFKERWRKVFAKPTTDEPVLYKAQQGMELDKLRTLSPIPGPLVRSLAPIMDTTLKEERGWLMAHDSHMTTDHLPYWMGQVILQGIDTERIDDVTVGRVFHSPMQPFPGNMTPPRMRVGGRKSSAVAVKLLAGVQQLHAEVWVASCEDSASHIEIVDVLAKPPKVRQRFMVRPKAKKILCMKSIPGVVAESKDFTDSSSLSRNTSWVESSFIRNTHPDFTQSMVAGLNTYSGGSVKKRPRSAPQRRQTFSNDYMGSSPDLSSCSEPGPLELFGSNRLLPEAASSKPRPEDTTPIDSFTNSLSTINESDHTPTRTPSIIVTPEPTPTKSGGQLGASIIIQEEDIDYDESLTNGSDINLSSIASTEGQSSRCKEVTSTPVSSLRSKQPLPISPLHQSSSKSSLQETDAPLLKPGSNTLSAQGDVPDGRTEQKKEEQRHPVVWVVTDSDMLYFYPTTPPSHKPINSVQLHARAVCIEYIRGKVFMGHSDSTLSVYYVDEFSHMWDVENPERISLPSPNAKEVYDVQCIAAVKDRIWVGCGSSIFFLDSDLPASREGSIFLDSWRRNPRQILPLGDIVVVTTTSTCLYIFDAKTTHLIQKINIISIAKLLDLPVVCDPKNTSVSAHTAPTITKVVSDDANLYIGTSLGKMVAVPISSLMNLRDKFQEREELTSPVDFSIYMPKSVSLSPTHVAGEIAGNEGNDETDGFLGRKKKEKKKRKKKKEVEAPKEESKEEKKAEEDWEELQTAEQEDTDGPYLENTAISLHSLNDSEVQSLIHLRLPDNQILKLKPNSDPIPYHSMPNLSSPFGGRVPISPPIVTYKTVILSAGKGHMEYITEDDPEAIQESINSARRERNEAFQMLTWGHKNVLP